MSNDVPSYPTLQMARVGARALKANLHADMITCACRVWKAMYAAKDDKLGPIEEPSVADLTQGSGPPRE